MIRVLRAPVVPVFAALLAAGCSGSAGTVTGEVTYDGRPVKTGYVTFAPADGKGPSAGGPITDGWYSVDNVAPGEKVVQIEASGGSGPSVQSSADMEKLSKEWRDKARPDGVIATETVPQNAGGNNQKTAVKPGPQTLDLHLTRPTRK